MSLRNPLSLSEEQEQQVGDLYYQRVRNLCAGEDQRLSFFLQQRAITVDEIVEGP